MMHDGMHAFNMYKIMRCILNQLQEDIIQNIFTVKTYHIHNTLILLFYFHSYRYQDEDGSGNEIPSNVNNNNSPPSVPYDKKLKLDMTSRKYSSEAENDPENSDLIGKLLGIPDKTINKLLSSADEAAKILGVNK